MDDEVIPEELLEEGCEWLFRGMFLRSPDDDWMRDIDEIEPPARERRGAHWRDQHRTGATATAYSSWSTYRETARMFGKEASDDAEAPGEVVVFRVRIDTLTNPCFYGRTNEDEILIEGIVENVELSDGLEEEDENG